VIDTAFLGRVAGGAVGLFDAVGDRLQPALGKDDGLAVDAGVGVEGADVAPGAADEDVVEDFLQVAAGLDLVVARLDELEKVA
jgi:hypothetical protein